MTAVRDLLTALTRDPGEATARQKVGAVLLIVAALVLASVEWT